MGIVLPFPAPVRFSLGRCVVTNGALVALAEANQDAAPFLDRHATGDWGNVPAEDVDENEWSLANEARLVSSYQTAKGVTVWVITEADRSRTTILLPEEY